MYTKLPYEQYFIDTSNDCGNTGKARYKIEYRQIKYQYKGLECYANYEVHYEEDRDVIQVNFEQTNEKIDGFVNFMFVEKYYDKFKEGKKGITLKVHNGGAAMYKAMKHQVRNAVDYYLELHPRAEVEIVGGSLGSSQAMLCAQDLYHNFGIRSHLYTYGSVNPFKTNMFNRHKIRKYLRGCCKEVYNFSDLSDIVTYVPFRFLGFIKFKRINVGTFNFFNLFKPMEYHTHYGKEDLYKKLIKKENN